MNPDKVRVYGRETDPGALEQIRRCAADDRVVDAVMMADHHLGYSVPIGGVLAYEGHISPSGVGFDIGCGNKAVMLDVDVDDVRKNIASIMDRVVERVSFGMGRNNDTKVDHPLFEDAAWDHEAVRPLKAMARNQLGTVGAGNHYVDIFVDTLRRVWVGCHFGSRGLGHKTATWFLKAGGAKDGIHEMPLVLDVNSDLGRAYIECMELAGEYAYAGRDWVCQEVADIIGGAVVTEVHNHHNFAWRETHGGRDVWVVRKGATPAAMGQRGFIGSSMGEPSHIIVGSGHPDTIASAVHGAGRAISRTAAKGRFRRDENGKKQREPGLVRHDEWLQWVADVGVELRGGDVDESPQAYKRLSDVMREHTDHFMSVLTLHPIGVAMAGRDIVDPFKD